MLLQLTAAVVTAALLLVGQAAVGTAPGLTAEEVARQSANRETGRDSRAEMRMRLYDRRGRMRERVMTLLTRRSGGDGDRTLVRFDYPNDIRNTALLVWEHPAEEDERFLYLPALGRVRRISGNEKQESFAGSDLSYEDIGGRELADYTYAFANEDALWTAADGSVHEAWLLESRTTDPRADYPRSTSLIRKDTLMMVHAEMLNRRNERAKIFDVTRVKRIDGIWTAVSLVVTNERDRTRTELDITSIRYNVGLTEEDFSRRALEQAPR